MTRREPAQPFNILLDPLPDSYEGWLIRTDYRIGIQISLCLEDQDLNEEERVTRALWLLYGNGIPPFEIALDGLHWFMNCGQPKRDDVSHGGGSARFWFDFDHARIAASIRQSYGLEIHREKLHWFEFMAMLDCVNEDSSLSNALQIRGTDTSQMKGKQRRDFERIKKLVTPPVHYTDEEQEAIEAFFSK